MLTPVTIQFVSHHTAIFPMSQGECATITAQCVQFYHLQRGKAQTLAAIPLHHMPSDRITRCLLYKQMLQTDADTTRLPLLASNKTNDIVNITFYIKH